MDSSKVVEEVKLLGKETHTLARMMFRKKEEKSPCPFFLYQTFLLILQGFDFTEVKLQEAFEVFQGEVKSELWRLQWRVNATASGIYS